MRAFVAHVRSSYEYFNEETLRHCSSNVAHDVEGYKSLIARPYESVNRAMPGSYYSDVERTIYLTFVILTEDIAKYDELFQQERKFISYEFYSEHIRHLDFDDLIYGNVPLSVLVVKHPQIKDGLARFLYEIILRRMEIRDRSRSVNSVDVVFNFDAIGFTGSCEANFSAAVLRSRGRCPLVCPFAHHGLAGTPSRIPCAHSGVFVTRAQPPTQSQTEPRVVTLAIACGCCHRECQ